MNRGQLFGILQAEHVPPVLRNILRSAYNKETSELIINGTPTVPWPVRTGVRQGACTSPTLFNLIPEMLARTLTNVDIGMKVGDKTVNVLMYADDIILIANSKPDLEALVRHTEQWASFHELTINATKTEYVVFGRNPRERLWIGERWLAPKTTTTYLGYLRRSGFTGAHAEQQALKADKACFATIGLFRRLPHLPTDTKLTIGNACVRATALYGMEAMRVEKLGKLKKQLNKRLRRVARAATGLTNA